MVAESLVFENLKLLARVSERPGDGNIKNNFKQWETSFQLRRKIASMVAQRLFLIASRVPRTACCDEGHAKPCIKTDERNVLCTLEWETFVFFPR